MPAAVSRPASEGPAFEDMTPLLAPTWLPAATCTEGSFRWENQNECCGISLSRTLFLQQKCVGGTWTYTGLSRCTLPGCFIP